MSSAYPPGPYPPHPAPQQPHPGQAGYPEPTGYVTPAAGSAGPRLPSVSAGPPTGQLVLILKAPPGLLSTSITSPKVMIDGYPVPARWGVNTIPAPAGMRRLHVRTGYVWDYGAANFTAQVNSGQRTVVHYSAPMSAYSAGRMGYTEQPRGGAGYLVFVAVLAGVAIAVVLVTMVIMMVVAAG